MPFFRFVFAIIFLCVATAGSLVSADVVDIGTAGNSNNWKITGAGAADATSFQTNVNRTGAIAITSDALRTGDFVDGGRLAQFNGFWLAENEFFLPDDARDVVFEFDSFYANDRGLLLLNDIEIGNVDHLGATGDGLFKRTEFGDDEAYTFTGVDSGSVSNGFLFGEINTLTILVNNTGEISVTAPTRTLDGNNDATTAFINASVSFTSVPEPSCLGLLGLTGLVTFSRRRK